MIAKNHLQPSLLQPPIDPIHRWIVDVLHPNPNYLQERMFNKINAVIRQYALVIRMVVIIPIPSWIKCILQALKPSMAFLQTVRSCKSFFQKLKRIQACPLFIRLMISRILTIVV